MISTQALFVAAGVSAFAMVLLSAAATCRGGGQPAATAAAAMPFYAMDTAFHRPNLTLDQQLDLVKELGFDGVAWTEQPADPLEKSLAAIERRGLKMTAIYCAAKVTPDGAVTTSPGLSTTMKALKGHGVIVWLHLGGPGPAFDTLQENSPVVKRLHELADEAASNDLRIAIYPHLGEWTAHFADATTLARAVHHKSFGVTFNLCHCLAAGDGDKIPEMIHSAGPLLFTATINGADSGVTGGHWDKLIQPLGQGSFDVSRVVKTLKQEGFSGPVGFQGYAIKWDARAILEPTIAAWHKMNERP